MSIKKVHFSTVGLKSKGLNFRVKSWNFLVALFHQGTKELYCDYLVICEKGSLLQHQVTLKTQKKEKCKQMMPMIIIRMIKNNTWYSLLEKNCSICIVHDLNDEVKV